MRIRTTIKPNPASQFWRFVISGNKIPFDSSLPTRDIGDFSFYVLALYTYLVTFLAETQ